MSGPARLARVAVVGGGPSGFYAAEALLRAERPVHVDMFERLPVPYGLVRFGVAPDHPKLKQVTRIFDRIAKMPGFRFFGGIDVGETVSIEALRHCYHAVVLATGASVSRLMGIPGEALPGSFQAGDFVAWYNGHPEYRDRSFDFSGERAVIIGHGNVALDVARILAKSVDELSRTDIAAHALDALAESRIREINIVGRRGPSETKFAAKELEEFEALDDCATVIDAPGLAEAVTDGSGMDEEAIATLAVLRRLAAATGTKRRRCIFRFGLAPLAIEGDGRVERMIFKSRSQSHGSDDGQRVAIDCELAFSSIGRRSAPLPGIPFDDSRGVHANVDGRLVVDGQPLPGLYVCGWGKRGPQGTIGTNRGCSVDTIERVLADLPQLDEPTADADSILGALARSVDYAAWERIDAAEIARGSRVGKPREKFVSIAEMIAAADAIATC